MGDHLLTFNILTRITLTKEDASNIADFFIDLTELDFGGYFSFVAV
jgi:hypothetical protein